MLKFGSSNRCSCGFDGMNATERDRWVARLLACWLATYPVRPIALRTAVSAAGLTLRPPFSTRDTVPLDTPAAAATSSMVGRAGPAGRPSGRRTSAPVNLASGRVAAL
jgi:hypothetical protein